MTEEADISSGEEKAVENTPKNYFKCNYCGGVYFLKEGVDSKKYKCPSCEKKQLLNIIGKVKR